MPAMLDLRDDGTIGIDFEDGKDPVVVARPKFGAYRRLRADAQRRVDGLNAYLLELRSQDPPLPIADVNEKFNERSEEATVEWWKLVLLGDDTFARMTTVDVPPVDDWPAYLIFGASVVNEVLAHWRQVPLARGGKLVPAETTETPEAAPTPA